MPVFSSFRDAIFTKVPETALQTGEFPNFYALLGVEKTASRAQIEDAITSRAADLLAANFSRGGKSEYLTLLQRHIADFRTLLLHETTRHAYDEQLRRHETGEAGAESFVLWKNSLTKPNRVQHGPKTASMSFKARLRAAFWEAEYF